MNYLVVPTRLTSVCYLSTIAEKYNDTFLALGTFLEYFRRNIVSLVLLNTGRQKVTLMRKDISYRFSATKINAAVQMAPSGFKVILNFKMRI